MSTPAEPSPGSPTSSFARFTQRQSEHFPLNTFFALQTFRLFYGSVDLLGGLLEYPLALLQRPFGNVMPSIDSEIQTAINQSRYRNINTDVI